MKKNRVLVVFIVVSILVFIGLVFSVYRMISKDAAVFYTDGYVSVSTSESSEKVYFKGGSSYKNAYNNNITFKNAEDEKIEVNKYNFVLYNNKSIGFLSDGVIMDANKLNETFIPYYNIRNNYVIEYTSGKYVLATRDKDIVLDNFIGRIDDSKYIVAGNDLRLKVSSSEDYITGYYFELIFSEGNVVKIDNDSVNFETISDEAYILIGDKIKIDLAKQAIFYDGEVKVNLSEIIIDNNSNIDIVYDGIGSGGDGDGEGDGNTGGGSGEGEENTTNNTLDPSQFEYRTESITQYNNIPYVELVNSNSNAHKIELGFRVVDTSNLISGPVNVRILNTATGESSIREYANYTGNLNYIADNLTSNTSYVVTIYASYVRDENVYRDYVMFQRTFNTTDLGISLERDYVTSSEISYNIILDKNATFKGAKLNLYDSKGNLVDSFAFTNDSSNINAVFDGLDSDTKYTAKIESVDYGTVRYVSGSAVTSSETTLKYNPFRDSTISSPTATINKKDYQITFDLGEVQDKDTSIMEVKYQVYNKETGELVKTITKSDTNEVVVKIDDDIEAHKTYYFNAVVTLNDGEKIVDYKTLNSNDFNIDNKINPTMKFIQNEIQANSISGYFKILDPDNAVDTNKEISAEYFSTDGEVLKKYLTYTPCPETENSTTKCANISLGDLKSSEVYTINLYAYVDLKDEEIPAGQSLIGGVKLNTEKADTINTIMKAISLDESDSLEKVFEIEMSLALENEENEALRDDINGFDIMLYEGYEATGMYLSSMHIDAETAKSMFEGKITIDIRDFNFSLEKLQQLHIHDGKLSKQYSIKLRNGSSGNNYIEFKADYLNFEVNDVLLGLVNSEATINVTPILNNPNNSKHDNNLNNDTIIGLKITPSFSNRQFALAINYNIYDVTNPDDKQSKKVTVPLNLSSGSPAPITELYFADSEDFLKRGRSYYVEYTISLDLNGDGTPDLEYPFSDLSIKETNPVKSEVIDIPKQSPSLALFPWTSTNNSILYKYQAVDVDNSLPNNFNLGYQIGEDTKYGESANCGVSDNISSYNSKYSCANFSGLNAGDIYGVFVEAYLYEKQNTPATRIDISNFTFEGNIPNLDEITFNLELQEDGTSRYTNILAINISEPYDLLSEEEKLLSLPLRNRIAYYIMTITGPNNTKFEITNITNSPRSTSPYSANVINFYNGKNISKTWTIQSGTDSSLYNVAYVGSCTEAAGTCIFLDYSRLYNSKTFKSEFGKYKNSELKITLSAMYDTGKIGYLANSNKRYVFQVQSNDIISKSKVYNNLYMQTVGSRNTLTTFNENALGTVYAYLTASSNGFVDDGPTDNEGLTGQMTFANLAFTNLSLSSSNLNGNYFHQRYNITHRGVETTYSLDNINLPIVAKELGTAVIPGEKAFNYDKIVPAINVLSSAATVNGAKFNLQISGLSEEDAVADSNGKKYLYLEVYDNDNNIVKEIKVNKEALTSQKGVIVNNSFNLVSDDDYKIDITSVTIGGRTAADYKYDYRTGVMTFDDIEDNTEIAVTYRIVLDDLDNGVEYTLKAYMYMGKNKTKTYLASIASSTYSDFEYSFTTKAINLVNVTGAKFDITSLADYKTRYLTTSYTIDDIVGIDDLEYEICNQDKTVCVNINKNIEEDSCYNKFDYSCISKATTSYNVNFTHDISITNDLDFVFNDNYNLIIKAKITGTTGQSTYEIYNNSLNVRALNDPVITVAKKSSHTNNYYISFDISISDPDRVVSKPDGGDKNGYYVAYLAGADRSVPITNIYDKNGNPLPTKQYINLVEDGIDVTKTLTFGNLDPDTEYNLIIEYRTYRNNKDLETKNKLYSIPYLIFTLDNNNISIGVTNYTATSNSSTLKFGYATNITRDYIKDESGKLIPDPNQEAYVAGINYVIRRRSGDASFQISGEKIFKDGDVSYITGDTSTNEVGENYYQITLDNTNYPVAATYYITFQFYLGGNITKDLNTEEICHNNSISNYWDADKNECYILGNVKYTDDTLYGGVR